MFGAVKRTMAVAAVVGAGAFAAPVASAATWDHTGAAHLEGQLTMRLEPQGIVTTCDVTATLDLSNSGGAQGQVTTALFGSDAGGSCATNQPGCTVRKTANTSTPWSVSAAGAAIMFSGVSFTTTFSGASCSFPVPSIPATGSFTGTVSGNAISFSLAGPLSTPLVPLWVSGALELYAEDANGYPDYGVPISLIP